MPRPAARPPVRLAAALAAAVALAACSAPDRLAGPRRNALPAYTGPDPVIFVHGWHSNAGVWTTMLGRFRADGWAAGRLHAFSYDTRVSNADIAFVLRHKVDSVLAATGATKVDVVTHSMGALSARYYTRYLGGDARVDAWVSLGGPNYGTDTALLCGQRSCIEMRRGSSFLGSLNLSDPTPGAPRYATWWSPCDEVILPQSSTVLTGATNTRTGCIRHGQLHQNATIYGQLREWVRPSASATAVLASVR
jgi:triacylglycerol lipase